jgi:hypothetical protein
MLPGLCKLGCASDSANPFSAASPVLGCVTTGFSRFGATALIEKSEKSLRPAHRR